MSVQKWVEAKTGVEFVTLPKSEYDQLWNYAHELEESVRHAARAMEAAQPVLDAAVAVNNDRNFPALDRALARFDKEMAGIPQPC